MKILKTYVSIQESVFGGTWSYKVLIDTDKGVLVIPSYMGYSTGGEAKAEGEKYALKVVKENSK